MDSVTESTIRDLLGICMRCNNHKINKDSYTSPGFAEFLNRSLRISDIPMQSWIPDEDRSPRKDLTTIPWEDSLKNFIFDLTSVATRSKFDTCIILTELGYKFTYATINIINEKYSNKRGRIIDVSLSNDDEDIFIIGLTVSGKLEGRWNVDRDCLVSSLQTWYADSNTLIMCHDNNVKEYREVLSMMPKSTWSISCTLSNFIQAKLGNSRCEYICPVYSCAGSLETRAVGNGLVSFTSSNIPGEYEGKLNYYLRCVRGSRHTSGRCYDCQILYKVLTSVYKPPTPSPVTPRVIQFSNSFLDSVRENKLNMQ